MSFIDWSDSQEMFGLLLEYVADEHTEAANAARRMFLARLKKQLEELAGICDVSAPGEAIGALRAVHRSIPEEYSSDPVVEHLLACIEELERIQASSANRVYNPPPTLHGS